MRKFLCVLLSVALVMSVNAWADVPNPAAKVKKAKKCLFPKSRKRAPSWICDAHVDGMAVTAVGSAAKSRAGISFMEQMAAADARKQLAWNLRGASPNNAAPDSAADRDSTWATRIANESLQGTKIVKRAYGPGGTLYVLVGVDEASAQKLHESISADYQGQQRK